MIQVRQHINIRIFYIVMPLLTLASTTYQANSRHSFILAFKRNIKYSTSGQSMECKNMPQLTSNSVRALSKKVEATWLLQC